MKGESWWASSVLLTGCYQPHSSRTRPYGWARNCRARWSHLLTWQLGLSSAAPFLMLQETKKRTQKKIAALEMQNINTKNFKQFGNGFCPQVNRFHQVTQLTFQKEWATQCQEQTTPGTSTGQSAHWQVTLSPRCSNSSVKAVLHLFYRRKMSLEAAIRMTESGVCTYLHVRSSSNWHLRSKYSVHCDKSLKQV